MAPPVAIIVGTTIIGAGLAAAFHKYAWPHIEPHAQELVENWKVRFKSTFSGRRRHRAQPSTFSDHSEDDTKHLIGVASITSQSDTDPAKRRRPGSSVAGSASASEKERAPGLRQRTASRKVSSERLFDSDVEMIELDQSHPLIFYTPMTPTHSRSPSRATAASTTAADDIDPFEEPSVPVATAIPLPLSPSASLADASNPNPETPSYLTAQSRSSTAMQSFATAPTQQPSAASTPNIAAAPLHPQPQSPFGTVRRSRHHPSSSQTSNPSTGVLSPPTIPSAAGSADARSPVARATSPSGMSDTMSLVSATPSRTWTDGGTADIFSGDERDFQEADADSDDDVRSVSESGSWESVSAAGRGDSLAGSGRLPRR